MAGGAKTQNGILRGIELRHMQSTTWPISLLPVYNQSISKSEKPHPTLCSKVLQLFAMNILSQHWKECQMFWVCLPTLQEQLLCQQEVQLLNSQQLSLEFLWPKMTLA